MNRRRPPPSVRVLSAAASLIAFPFLSALPAQAQAQAATSSVTANGVPAAVLAAQPSSAPETVLVTGSRLATTDSTSQDPVTVITARQITDSSATTAEDVLRKLTSSGTSGVYNTTNNGGQGISCYDLHNLQSSRTLVLIDGKRVVQSGIFGGQCVDLDNIPVQMIDRVEVLKDGASSIYGADAVAGVVNFILKKNFNGTQINVGGDLTDVGDDRTGTISALKGFDFANGRGNFMISGNYSNVGAVNQADRAFASPVASSENVQGVTETGSEIRSQGTLFDGPNVSSSKAFLNQPSGLGTLAAGNGVFRPATLADNFDLAKFPFAQGSLESENVTAKTYYDLTDHITAYVNAFYTHKQAVQQLAPQPVVGAVTPTPGGSNPELPDAFIVPAGNPFNPFGEDVDLEKRVNEFGPRNTTDDQDTYQITGGIRGSLAYGWNYDLSYLYGKSQEESTTTGEVNFQRLEQEVGFRQTFDQSQPSPLDSGVFDSTVCTSQPGCTLINPFGPSSISKAGVDFASFTEHSRNVFQLRQVAAALNNNHVFNLPYGPVGIALGVEHRSEDGAYVPDPLVQSGVTLENSQLPTSGGFNVTEVYGEARVPILANLPAVKDLSADFSGRFSNYNTFGSAETWKASLNYAPVQDIRFRANIGTAFRQPDVNELFGGQSISFNAATDPCQGASGVAATNCARQGLGPNFRQTGDQVQTISGGNPNLQPEQSRTYTIGTVIQPRWIKNFSAEVDYWHTSITNTIGSLSTQQILTDCFNSPNLTGPDCALVGPRSGNGQLNSVFATDQNLGATRTNGLDIDLSYNFMINSNNRITLTNSLSKLIGYVQQQSPSGPFVNFAGRLETDFPEQAFPRLRDNATVTWTHGPASFSYTMRYISGMRLTTGLTDDSDTPGAASTSVPGIFYHDIVGTYHWRKFNFVAGIDNLFDKNPPFVPDGTINTDPNVYDILGRLIYLRAQLTF